MEAKKKIAVEKPIILAGSTLIPVVRILANRWQGKNGLSFFASKEPIAIGVISPLTKQAFRITGEEISLDALIEEVPEIKDIIERLEVK